MIFLDGMTVYDFSCFPFCGTLLSSRRFVLQSSWLQGPGWKTETSWGGLRELAQALIVHATRFWWFRWHVPDVYRCQFSTSKSFGCVRTGAEATFTVVNFTMNVGLLTLPCLFAQHGWSTGATEWVDTRKVTGQPQNPQSNTAEIALMFFVHPLCIKPGRHHHGVCRHGMCLHCFVHAGKLLGLFEQVDKLIWAWCFFHPSASL